MQLYTLSQTSLAKAPSSVTELYIPLWMADGTTITSTASSAGTTFAGDGYGTDSSTSTRARLHTLNTSWPSTQNFALEVTIYQAGASGANAALWDFTSSSLVALSQVSTTSTTAVVVRSGKFTLTPGHVYGVTFWSGNTSTNTYISDAHLIVFP